MKILETWLNPTVVNELTPTIHVVYICQSFNATSIVISWQLFPVFTTANTDTEYYWYDRNLHLKGLYTILSLKLLTHLADVPFATQHLFNILLR